jgi:hypothetical protein
MTNVLLPLANAALVWSVASGYVVESGTGNYVPTSTGVTYYATLKQKRNPQYDYLLGADNTAVYMEEKDGLSYCRTNKLPSIIGSSSAHQSEASLDWLVKEAYKTFDA